ncbi:hypothetical protein Tco_1285614 [Tanacetum coccineum]
MDSMISIGQKNTLNKDLYDSWKSIMELYMQNKEHGRMILESVEHGPLSCQGSIGKNSTTNASLPPEWSKFLTDVKLVKDLHTTNFDHLHAYLQQHELHANEVRIMPEHNHDPLALVPNHQQTPSHSNTYLSSYNNPEFQQQFSPSLSNGVREYTEQCLFAKLSPCFKTREHKNVGRFRIKQYFQIQDYALWEVIENGNSWVPIPVTTPPESGTSTTTKMTVPATIEEKTCKKNDVKARSLLLMALPNEHQLTFDQYVDAQSMFAAIKARFGGNEATKKTQKALLKQQYENFSASSSESLDSIFNRLQKLVSRLAILGVVTPPEDLNVKFLRSLPSEWDTHVVVWMNKLDFDTMGLDDLDTTILNLDEQKNISTVIKWDILLGNAEHLGVKTTEIGIKVAQQMTAKIKDASEKEMFCLYMVLSFDWSDMAEEEIQSNMALMVLKNSKEPRDDEEQEFAQEDGSKTKPEKKTVIPTAAKIEKPVRKPVKYAEMYRSQRPRGNQRNLERI